MAGRLSGNNPVQLCFFTRSSKLTPGIQPAVFPEWLNRPAGAGAGVRRCRRCALRASVVTLSPDPSPLKGEGRTAPGPRSSPLEGVGVVRGIAGKPAPTAPVHNPWLCRFERMKRQPINQQFCDIDMLAGVLHIDTDDPAGLIKIEHDAIRDFVAVGAGALNQMDVERVCFRVIGQSHGLYLL